MNLAELIQRILSGRIKGWPRLIGIVLLVLVLGYSWWSGQEPDGTGGFQTSPSVQSGAVLTDPGRAVDKEQTEVDVGSGAASASASDPGDQDADRRTGFPSRERSSESRREPRSGQTARDGATARVGVNEILVSELPKEAQATLALILKGGPYPYEKDGTVFGNREGLLPKQRRGYYTEYTVRTPKVNHRGARRIVAGGAAGRLVEFYYTDDHYQSFKRIKGVNATD